MNLLNLDGSYPVEDSFHATNTAGRIRFLDASDPLKLPNMQRMQGDFVHRSKLIEEKINEIIVELSQNPAFPSFDSSVFSRVDGTAAFTAPVSGIDPTLPAHLSTKGYTDQRDAAVSASVSAVDAKLTSHLGTAVTPLQSNWVQHTWQAGVKVHTEFSLVIPSGSTPDYTKVSAVMLVERLDIAQVTEVNPTPDPIYVYSTLAAGVAYGFKLDALWLDPATNKVHALIPNEANYISSSLYPGVSQYEDLLVPRTRHLRAVVMTPVV